MSKKPKSIKFKDIYEALPEKRKKSIEIEKNRIMLSMQIKKLRKMKKLSSMELAKESNVSYKTISKIENNKPVNFDSVIKVINSLGLTINYSLK